MLLGALHSWREGISQCSWDKYRQRLGKWNGMKIKYHSLSFRGQEDKRLLQEKLGSTEVGETMTIESSPSAVNVELFADFDDTTPAETAKKTAMRN